MKCLLLADTRSDLLSTLEPVLKHWGYRVLSARNAEQAQSFLEESDLCLLIISHRILVEFDKDAVDMIKKGGLPLLCLNDDVEKKASLVPVETLSVPVDIFALFSFIQTHVEKHPRHNLRLPLRLPGMYKSVSDEYMLADVLSLSMKGLFFKVATRVEKGDRITVVFPLLGHCKEVEINSTVLYVVQPTPENNFMQGFGVGFDDLSTEYQDYLQTFIEDRFLTEVSNSGAGIGEFSNSQVKT